MKSNRALRWVTAVAIAAAILGSSPSEGAAQQPGRTGRVIVVRMKDDAYEPAMIQARVGDVVRFVQEGRRAHNVEFKKRGAPEGFEFGAERRGPYIKQQGAYYDVVIDERFASPGAYPFICTPHVMAGMKGNIQIGG